MEHLPVPPPPPGPLPVLRELPSRIWGALFHSMAYGGGGEGGVSVDVSPWTELNAESEAAASWVGGAPAEPAQVSGPASPGRHVVPMWLRQGTAWSWVFARTWKWYRMTSGREWTCGPAQARGLGRGRRGDPRWALRSVPLFLLPPSPFPRGCLCAASFPFNRGSRGPARRLHT